MNNIHNLAVLLEAFFTDRLMRQRHASPETIASYRDTFCLLLRFANERLKKSPSQLELQDLSAPFIGGFLDHLEKERGNSARTRNTRLAAIRSFFKYVALREPAHSVLIQRVLAMPSKRYDKAQIEFLTYPEVNALLEAPDRTTWAGRRDRALLLLAVQTGLRVSELTGLSCQDVVVHNGAHVHCKGKERCTPLRKEAVAILRAWLADEQGSGRHQGMPANEVKVSPDDISEVSLQGYGVPTGQGGYQSIVFRTKPVTLQDKRLQDMIDEGRKAELFSVAFRAAITETFPVQPEGLIAIESVGSTTDGRTQWEFTLNLATPRSPEDVLKVLGTIQLQDLHVHPPL